jgi:hypothetical protein
LPYVIAFAGFNIILSVAREMNSNNEKVAFVSAYVAGTTTSIWSYRNNFVLKKYVSYHRGYNDFLKQVMVGVGGCGELAMAVKTFLDNLGLETRIVAFPGENHELIEVKLNDAWIVVDPGYTGSKLLTRAERGLLRIKELGGLSYAVAYTEQGFIELTRDYAPTDTIVVRVMYDDEPLANAKVVLSHKFMNLELPLPEMRTDINGTVIFHLGPMAYNRTEIEPAEPYYWIYVNDFNTKNKVTSTASEKFHIINIDLKEQAFSNN